jgi:microcystin-dependent protein
MAVNYTPILHLADANASTFNSPLQDLDDVIEDLRDGSVALTAPTVTSMTNAQHDHLDAAGGSKLDPDAIDSSGQASGDALVADGSGGNSYETIPTLPTGVLIPYAAAVAPASWLLCDGSTISRTTYADLFAVIGTTYGAGDGSTTFEIPDLRGRVIGGKDNMGGSSANRVTNANADTLGGAVGVATQVLTTAQMPAHTHGVTLRDSSATARYWDDRMSVTTTWDDHWSYTPDVGITDSAGSGSAHNNMQPTLFVNYIIKA